jgi:hypothetical protein
MEQWSFLKVASSASARILLIALLISYPLKVIAVSIHVPADYPLIQSALDAASVGDSVVVAPGIYRGLGNVNLSFRGKDCVLIAELGPELTVIDGEQEYQAINLTSGETLGAVVAGFTIQNCLSHVLPGGAIRCEGASVTLKSLILKSNACFSAGGAICISNGAAVIEATTVQGNIGEIEGGGIALYSAVVEIYSSIVQGNQSNWGGGICIGSGGELIVDNTDIEENSAVWDGGGIICRTGSSVTLNSSVVRGNDAEFGQGGGISVGGVSVIHIGDTYIEKNSAALYGGGLSILSAADVDLSRTIFALNEAGGVGGGAALLGGASIIMDGCTFVKNRAGSQDGGGFYLDGVSCEVLKVIIANNEGFGISAFSTYNLLIECVDCYGNSEGEYGGDLGDATGINGNISVDPMFCGTGDTLNFHLDAQSPCLPEHSPCSELIGALGIGCSGTTILNASVSSIKTKY